MLLHDHLDGGLRPGTIAELAEEISHRLPVDDGDALTAWFHAAAEAGDLPAYLERFSHAVAVLQSGAALRRVARECVEDLAADGVVYAEVRFAPELHLERGLELDEVVQSVLAGLAEGMADARTPTGQHIAVGLLCTAMRTAARSAEIAELALRHRDDGVVGFDIAGEEAGYPPTRHLEAFQLIQRESGHITIHAGEAFGLSSIWEALQFCGAERLGHGVRIVDDITELPDGASELGRLAAFVRDRRIPLEMCPNSNVHTGAAPSLPEHPVGLLRRLHFRVTVNTDNRLMSNTTLSDEFAALAEAFGFGWDDVEWLTINAMKSAFWPFDDRLRIINTIIKPGFSGLRSELGLPPRGAEPAEPAEMADR